MNSVKLRSKVKLSITLGLAIFCIAMRLKGINFTPNTLSMKIVSPEHKDIYQVFFDIGRGFTEGDSLRVTAQPDRKSITLNFIEFPAQQIKTFRLDPGTRQADILVKSISLDHASHRLEIYISLISLERERFRREFYSTS